MAKVVFAAVAVVALVSGCGGGGGGGGGGSQSLVCTSPATIQAANIDVGDSPTAQRTLQHVFDTTSVETLSYSMGKLWMTDIGRTITGSGTISCSGGGTATITDTDADNNLLQNGDTLALSFNNCKPKASSPVLKGSVSMRVTSVSGDPYTANSAWNLGLQMVYTNLQSNVTAAACGTVDLTMATTAGSGIYTGSVSGSSYTVANTNTKRTLSGYSFTYSEPELDAATGWPVAGGTARLSGTGKVSSADSASGSINGSVDFTIPTELVGTYSDNQGNGQIGSGQVRVNGGNASSVTMTAISTADVTLDLGSDGNVDTTVPWSAVLP